MRIVRSITEPIREGLTTAQLWLEDDNGLIASWERGRMLASEKPEVVEQARAGELVMLPWKGGVDRKLKAKAPKIGSYRYLAMWQGLRGDDLELDPHREITLVCTKYGQEVLYTNDLNKLGPPEDDETT